MRQALVRTVSSFRFRLTLWYLALLTVTLLVVGYYVYLSESHALLEAFNAQLQARVERLESSYMDNGLLAPPALDGQDGGAPGGTGEAVLLITPEGHILQTFGDLSSASWAQVAGETRRLHGLLMQTHFYQVQLGAQNGPEMTYGFTSSIERHNHTENYLIVGLPSDVPDQSRELLVILLLAFPVVVILSTSGGFWLANHALRPIQAITRTAQRIGESDLTQRLGLERRDEIGELAATFDHMLDRLEAAFLRQRQFTADASHELRTPLTIIDLEANRVLAAPLSPAEYQEAIALIQKENRAVARLVNDLLTLARAEGGQTVLKREKVDLSEVVLETVARLTPLASRQSMKFKLSELPELILIGDRDLLSQLVTNLVENALKHAAGVGDQVHLDMGSERNDGQSWIWLRVADNGPGISSEHLPHLFERFYRVDQARTRSAVQVSDSSVDPSAAGGAERARPAGSSGLGLSIAQWIAQAHRGYIQVHSTLWSGTTFEVWLPAE
jgi:two-component system, OmpR family, sensor kinase